MAWGLKTSDDVFEFYRYNPSITAAVLFIILFSTATYLHIYQLIRTQTWIFLPLALGGLSNTYVSSTFPHVQANSQRAKYSAT